jgi:hypothetical protein
VKHGQICGENCGEKKNHLAKVMAKKKMAKGTPECACSPVTLFNQISLIICSWSSKSGVPDYNYY